MKIQLKTESEGPVVRLLSDNDSELMRSKPYSKKANAKRAALGIAQGTLLPAYEADENGVERVLE